MLEESDGHVLLALRRYRDEVLERRTLGRTAIAAYEFVGLTLARMMSTAPRVRILARWAIAFPAGRFAARRLKSPNTP